MDFHIILKNLRKKNRKTQAELAALLQIDQSTYAHYESGRRTPDIEKLKKLACYYGLRDEILGVGMDEDSGIPAMPMYAKNYSFPRLFKDSPVDLSRIYPTKQKIACEINKALTNDDRVVSAVLFGSSITMRCSRESDTDVSIRLNEDFVTRDVKNDISERVLEICDWKADIIWYDTLKKNEKIYHDILKGVQIV